jgi:hypothetical protein
MTPVAAAAQLLAICLLNVLPCLGMLACTQPGPHPARVHQFAIWLGVAALAMGLWHKMGCGSTARTPACTTVIFCESSECRPECAHRHVGLVLQAARGGPSPWGTLEWFLGVQVWTRVAQAWVPLLTCVAAHGVHTLAAIVTGSGSAQLKAVCTGVTLTQLPCDLGIVLEVGIVLKAAETVLGSWWGPGPAPPAGATTIVFVAATAAAVAVSGIRCLQMAVVDPLAVPGLLFGAVALAWLSTGVLVLTQLWVSEREARGKDT